MLKLATFNTRCPVIADGINYLPNRIPGIYSRIAKEAPDVIGFQELEESGLQPLETALPQYQFIGTGRSVEHTGEGARIAFHRERVALLAMDQFWLSETPRVPGSRYEQQSKCPRVAVWAKLLHWESGQRFYFVNTHLDHQFDEARALGLKQIFDTIRILKTIENLPVFISGDFNLTPDSPVYSLVAQNGFTDLTAGIPGSFHKFGKREPIKIDYILTDSNGRYDVQSWHECVDGLYLSDHDALSVCWYGADADN